MGPAHRYLPGDGVLLGTSRWWLLVGLPPAELPDGLYDELAATPERATPEDLVAPVSVHVGDRPWALVDLHSGGTVSGHGGRTRSEGDRVVLEIGAAADGPLLPFAGGVVAAARAEVVPNRPRQGMIDRIPAEILAGASDPEPATATSTGAVTAPTPHELPEEGTTMVRSAVASEPHALHQSTREMVSALACARGHLTQPERPACRVCGDPVPPAEARRVPRPRLGTLSLPDGKRVQLDRGAVLGRQPTPLPGGEAWPHLVELPGDATYLSRLHLEIRLEGWEVLARDLGSRGGTALVVPGRPPERLRADEACPVEPGHELHLSGEYVVRVEGVET